MSDYDQENDELEIQIKRLLAGIEDEPISEEVRTLANRLQALLDEKRAAHKKTE
ncbi:hypothetical protein ACSSV4_004675 [Roseovarius sp. MBR-154]